MVEANSPKPDEQSALCPCSKPREIGTVELCCSDCKRWYHGTCTAVDIENMLPFQLSYSYLCKTCNEKSSDHVSKIKSTFLQACVTTLANLLSSNPDKRYFSKDKDIIPFVEENWDILLPNRQPSMNWTNNILKALSTESFFISDSEGDDTFYSLVEEDLGQINPVTFKSLLLDKGDVNSSKPGKPPGKKGGASGKRKNVDGNGGPGKKSKMEQGLHRTKLSKWGYPLEHPHNKDNYRYMLAEPDPLAGTTWEQELAAGKPLPSKHYRTKLSQHVLLAVHDKAQQLKVDEDRCTVTGDKGYSLIRATHSVNKGTYYYEATIVEMPDNSAVRIGWAQQYANLQAPCGYDKFGYSWRSRKGTAFHNSRGTHFSSGFGVGDTLGFMIKLPYDPKAEKHQLPSYKHQALIKFKNHLYFEERDENEKMEKELTPLDGSEITLYKNGECLGTPWKNVYAGDYYPAVSLYKNSVVTVNFGPDFKHQPAVAEDVELKGMFEVADVSNIRHTLSDLLYHVVDRSDNTSDQT